MRLVQNACRNGAIAPGVTPQGPKYAQEPKKVQIYPNPVITILEINSLTFHNLHHIVLALCKVARPAQIKERIKNLVL